MAYMSDKGYSPSAYRRYRHMGELDQLVWVKFIEQWGSDIDQVWYDIWCGEGAGLAAGASEKDQRRADGIYCKRIDAVTLQQGLYQVWEVKPFGNSVALGQALLYLELFKKRYPECVPVQSGIVCDQFDGDCRPLIARLGIRCVAVGEANDS